MEMTISLVQSHKSNLSHNNREHTSGNPDIDLSKIKDNISYVQEDIEGVYHELFDGAVEAYNSNQKRNDRKINDYYRKILNDEKTHHQREVIFAIGTKEDNDDPNILKMKKEILDDFMQGFQKRNTNLKVYNAVLHLDEANPHLHINYIPHFESKRGLSRRVGFDKAIQQQGVTDFEEWMNIETGLIERELIKRGIKRAEKGTHKKMSVKEYKEIKDEIKALESAKNVLKIEVKEEEQVKYVVQSEIKALELHLETIKDFDNQHTPKVVLGRVTEQEFNHLKDSALKHLVQSVHLQEANKKLTQTVEKYARDNTYLEREVLDLQKEKKKINSYKDELSNELDVYRFFVKLMNLEKMLESSEKLIKSVINLVKTPYKFTLEQYESIQNQLGKTFEARLDLDEDELTQLKKSPMLENAGEWDLDR